MSCIATFYTFPDAQRETFAVTQNTDVASSSEDFHLSGFVIVDYLFTFVELPEDLQTQMTAGTLSDGQFVQFERPFAVSLGTHLEAHQPDQDRLAEFAVEQGQDPSEYCPLLTETHSTLIRWLSGLPESHFGVLHLSF